MNLAGLLTLARLGLAVLVPFAMPTPWILPLYLLALLTDVADGAIARRTGTASGAGAAFDAWVDKVLHVNIGWSLGVADRIPDWWMLLWFSREILQLPMFFVLMHGFRVGRNVPARTSLLGRATAVVLATAIIVTLIGWNAAILTLVTGILGAASAIQYGARHLPVWWRQLPRAREEELPDASILAANER